MDKDYTYFKGMAGKPQLIRSLGGKYEMQVFMDDSHYVWVANDYPLSLAMRITRNDAQACFDGCTEGYPEI